MRNQLPVVYLVLCDKQWGMVKMNQQFSLKPLKTLVYKSLGPGETINADLGEIRFDELARSMGSPRRAGRPIRRSCARPSSGPSPSGRCAVIHVDVDPREAHVGAQPQDVQGHARGAGA